MRGTRAHSTVSAETGLSQRKGGKTKQQHICFAALPV